MTDVEKIAGDLIHDCEQKTTVAIEHALDMMKAAYGEDSTEYGQFLLSILARLTHNLGQVLLGVLEKSGREKNLTLGELMLAISFVDEKDSLMECVDKARELLHCRQS